MTKISIKLLILFFAAFLAQFNSDAATLDDYRTKCTDDQLKVIQAAVSDAKGLIDRSISALPINNSSDATRFKEWFGTSSSDSGNDVKAVYAEMLAFIEIKTYWCPNATFSSDDAGTLAFVPRDSISEVFFQYGFFDLPNSEDTKAGVIIHEFSHLSLSRSILDSDVTGDMVPDYGKANARQLARTNPFLARHTADNYQYFAQSFR